MKQLAVWLQTGQLPLQSSFTRAPMKSSRPLLHPQSHTRRIATHLVRRWKGDNGIGKLRRMLKRVLFSCAVLIGTVYLACGGDSGTTDLKQKPQIVTSRDSIVDTLFVGQGRAQTLTIFNQGKDDLVVSSLQLTASDPGLVTGASAPFTLLANGVLDP